MRPRLSVLDQPIIEQIVDQAFVVLEQNGVLIEDPHALRRLEKAGLSANPTDNRVRMSRSTVEKALSDAPSSVTLHDRDGEPSAVLEGDNVHFVPASSALRILDRKTQEHRNPKTVDFIEYVKAADGLKNIDYLSTAFIPKDIPQDIADAWRLYLVLSHSKRPIVSGAFTAYGVPRMGQIMAMFREEGSGPQTNGNFHLLPEYAIAMGRRSRFKHHGLRRLGNPH
jgi:trimethylamine--corrinoid protein Co-methyltransferase